ncbi:hypothetical protein N8793_04740 [Pseudomonadales bacterium]|nr:hypothetical protein [Pseudomonadales bacterium]
MKHHLFKQRLPVSSAFEQQRGASLVELVSVIVLLGVMGTGLINFIAGGAEAYREVVRRDEVAQIGRFAIERVARELRSALPGSVRTSSNCIEFVPVGAASVYTELPVAGLASAANTFSVVSSGSVAGMTRAAVYTLNAADVYAGGNLLLGFNASSASTTAGETTYTFSSPPQQFAEQSPGRRIFFVDEPVSFCVTGTVTNRVLNRYSDYGYSAVQAVPPSGGHLLAQFIQLVDGGVVQPFQFNAGTLQSNGTVHLDFRFLARGTTSEWVRFSHDVVLQNVP